MPSISRRKYINEFPLKEIILANKEHIEFLQNKVKRVQQEIIN